MIFHCDTINISQLQLENSNSNSNNQMCIEPKLET